MQFYDTSLNGAYLIEHEPFCDERGFFSRSFCINEFHKNGLECFYMQTNLSYNEKKGTLRGMHFQKTPYEETKIVSCIKGSLYDVIVDLRPDSSSFKKWASFVLSGDNPASLYIPKGFAHGFMTLENDTFIHYSMSQIYMPDFATGIRWNDPAFAIDWPTIDNITISDKDKNYPDFIEESIVLQSDQF